MGCPFSRRLYIALHSRPTRPVHSTADQGADLMIGGDLRQPAVKPTGRARFCVFTRTGVGARWREGRLSLATASPCSCRRFDAAAHTTLPKDVT